MAEQEACASAVTEALAASGETADGGDEARGESLLLPLLQGLLGGGGERLLAGLGAAGADVVADVRRSLGRLRAALAPPTEHPQARALLALADRLEDALHAADRLDGCRRRPRRRSRAARHTVGVTHEELAQARRLVDRDHLALEPEPPAPPSDAASSTSTASPTGGNDPPAPDRKPSVKEELASFHDAVTTRRKVAPIAHSASFVDSPKVNREARVVEKRAPAARKPDFYRHSIAEGLQQQQQPVPQSHPHPEAPPQPQLQMYQSEPQPLQQSHQPQLQQRQQMYQPYSQPQQQMYQPQLQTQQQMYQSQSQPQQTYQTLTQPQQQQIYQPPPQSQQTYQPYSRPQQQIYEPLSQPQQTYQLQPQTQQQMYQPQTQPQQTFSPQSQPLQPMYQPQQPHPANAFRRPSDPKSGIAAIATKFDSKAKENTPAFPRRAPVERRRSPPPVSAPTITTKPVTREEPKRAPLYKPLPPGYNFAAPPPAEDFSKPLNRFSNNKRARMKRANTIDIGRPLGGYRVDSDTDDDSTRGPIVPKFQPQTENDKKFVAFMRKTEENQMNVNGQSNWSNRFGNIKNAFESRDHDDNSRSSSSSSARRFWRTTDESPPPSASRPRKFLGDVSNSNVIKPPWATERKDATRVHVTPAPQAHIPPQAHMPSQVHVPPQLHIPPPAPVLTPSHPPPVPQSPTRPTVVKPFVAKPIPVNQFSHAPMSAFKPPAKIMSPTSAPSHIWSPPSLSNTVSPTVEASQPLYTPPINTIITSPPIQNPLWTANDLDKPRKSYGQAPSKFDAPQPVSIPPPTYRERVQTNPPTPPTHVPQKTHNACPVKAIPSLNNLAAPELVKKIDNAKLYTGTGEIPPKVDTEKLQIEFYEKQIRERPRPEPMTNGHAELVDRKPPAPPAYTVTDYTPNHTISTFVPLQQTPDIEKARAHKVDYLPDVVMNEGERTEFARSPVTQHNQQPVYRTRGSPSAANKATKGPQNGDDGPTIEHGSVETRVMRGPVRGAATITAGVRTRNDEVRRDNLKGVLDKISSPKRDAVSQIERKKRENARNQVRAPVQNGLSPSHASPGPRPPPPECPRPPGPRSPALGSRESLLSADSAASSGSGALSRSGSWHQLAENTPERVSPRKVVARAKSMHLLSVPKLFEGGIARDELTEKKKTVEAYFSTQTSPAPTTAKSPAAVVRARAARSTTQYSLGRSRTMPTVSELQFLDESNADDAFEDLVSGLA